MLRGVSKCHLIYARSLLERRQYSKAIAMFKKTLDTLTILIGVLSNRNLIALYSHSPNMKKRDAAFMLLLTYINMAYCFQLMGKLEETMCSLEEAEFVVQYFLNDSSEAKELVSKFRGILMKAVVVYDRSSA